ncbi:hypothetical protein CK216_16470 [Mesorhizobium sp. WSM3876]|nr:hypothetical protein CK216_16470 [Mesorhizobium sp. WSM3876]
MTGGELARLRQQAADAQAHVDALLAQRQAPLDGAGPMPSATEVDRARAKAEVAEALVRTYERTAGRAA